MGTWDAGTSWQPHSRQPGQLAQPLLEGLARVVELRALTAEAPGHVPAECADFGEDGSHLPVDEAVDLGGGGP